MPPNRISGKDRYAIGFFGPELVKFRSGGLWSDGRVALFTGIPAIVGAITKPQCST